MGRFKLMVLSDPTEGCEDEFNTWYSDQHLADVVAVPGFRSARRFKLRTLTLGAFTNRYLAIYDMDADDPEAAVDLLMSLQGSAALPISPAINLDAANVAIFEACSDEVFASADAAQDQARLD